MINEEHAKKFCSDDISKIENYDKAINDPTQTWLCHHRNGLTLSHDDLIRMDMYYNRPHFELIFLTRAEHQKLHHTGKTISDETRKKLSESRKGKPGKPHSDEARKKISEARKGRTPNKGKTLSEESKKKISEARRAYWANKKKSEQSV